MRVPVAYTINHDGFLLELALVETENLLVHEEIIPKEISIIKQLVEQSGVQSEPIIIDKNSNVVLDGMHRTTVMKELHTRFISVCMIDYHDTRITVNQWCRLISSPLSEVIAVKLLTDFNFDYEFYEDEIDLEAERGLFLKIRKGTFRICTKTDNVLELFRHLYKMENKLVKLGYEVHLCPDDKVEQYLKSDKYNASFYLPKVKKHQVLESALNNDLFPPKSTRHYFPARLSAIDVPLSLLRNKKLTIFEANKKLEVMLQNKHLKRNDSAVGENQEGVNNEILYVFEEYD